jgi:hypothetical protein
MLQITVATAMKKVNVIILSSALMLAYALLPACNKRQGADTPFARVIGKWKKVQYATDDNGSGKIESYEIHDVESSVNNVLVFSADNTGYETNDFAPTLNFTWNIAGDSIYRNGSGHLSITYFLAAVNSYNLTLTTNTNLGLAWYNYQKQ